MHSKTSLNSIPYTNIKPVLFQTHYSSITNLNHNNVIKHTNFQLFINCNCIYSSSSTNGVLVKYNKQNDDLEELSTDAIFKIYHNINDNTTYYISIETSNNRVLVFTTINNECNICYEEEEDNCILFTGKIVTSDTDDNDNDTEMEAFSFHFNTPNELYQVQHQISKIQQLISFSFNNYNDYNDNNNTISTNITEYSEITNPPFITNTFTLQSYIHNRIFSFKNNNTISLYKILSSHQQPITSITLPPITPSLPSTALLSNADTSLLLLTSSSLYHYSLPPNKIISTYKTNTSLIPRINAISHPTKLSQSTCTSVLHCINSNTLFTLDLHNNSIIHNMHYKTNIKLSCIATSDKGDIVVGALNGFIRVYDKVIGKKAKIKLKVSDTAIKAVDVSLNGRYVVATCKQYLVFCDLQKESNVILKLMLQDVKEYGLQEEEYRKGRFDVQGKEETKIVGCVGKVVVIWRLKDVLNRKGSEYKIIEMNNNVIDNDVRYNSNDIIITTHDVIRIQQEI